MSRFVNIRGTSEPHFRIGLQGPTVYFGTDDPGTTPPTPIPDGLKDGDLYVRTSTPFGLYQYEMTGGTWSSFSSTGGSTTFTGDVEVQGEFDTGDNLPVINNGETGSGISHPSQVAGIEIDRGTLDNVSWVFDEANDYWTPQSDDPSAENVFVPNELTIGDTIIVPQGTLGSPSFYFDGDSDTGIYSPAANEIGLIGGGVSWRLSSGSWRPNTDGAQSIGTATNRISNVWAGGRLFSGAGTSSMPSHTFGSDQNTGMYSASGDQIGFSTSGISRFIIDEFGALRTTTVNYESTVVTSNDVLTNKAYVDNAVASASTSFPLHASPVGTQGAPAYSFSTSTNTGMFLDGSSLSFSTSGSKRFQIQTTGLMSSTVGSYETLVTSANDIPNKKYVDNAIGSITWREPVKVREDTVYANLSAAEAAMNTGTVDGITVTMNDRILYTAISGENKNVFKIVGTPGAGATLLEDTINPASVGDTLYIQQGTYTDKIQSYNSSLVWVDPFLTDVVNDTSPQLGGMLDVNGQAIGDGTLPLITFVEDPLSVNNLEIENASTGTGPIIRAVGSDTNIDLNLAAKGIGDVSTSADMVASSFIFYTDIASNISLSGPGVVNIKANGTIALTLESTEVTLGANLITDGYNIRTSDGSAPATLRLRVGTANSGSSTPSFASLEGGYVVDGSTAVTAGPARIIGGFNNRTTGNVSGGKAAVIGGNATVTSGNGFGGIVEINGGDGNYAGGDIELTPGNDTTDGSLPGTVKIVGAHSSVTAELRFQEASTNGTEYTALKAEDSITSSALWTLPSAQNSSGDPLGIDLGEYTVAGLPSASAYPNCWALATNASGGRTIVRSDGTNWKVVAVEGATVTT